jgi:metal-responsive CopG/Arc/MetJ family transcriptional regulator
MISVKKVVVTFKIAEAELKEFDEFMENKGFKDRTAGILSVINTAVAKGKSEPKPSVELTEEQKKEAIEKVEEHIKSLTESLMQVYSLKMIRSEPLLTTKG